MPARRSRAETLDREARAIDLRRNGATYDQIAERLGVSTSAAHLMVKRALDRHLAEAVPDVRKLELDRLDQLQVAAVTVLRREHHVVQAGKVVYVRNAAGAEVPLRDDGPTLAAVRTLLDIQARRARLLGLDAPTKVDVKVLTVDQMDDRIAELEQLLATNDALPQPTDAQLD
jgi:transposase